QIRQTGPQTRLWRRRQSRRTARADQGLVLSHHQGRRELRRIVRPKCRRRLQAADLPRAQPALEQGRTPVRAADPLIAFRRGAAMSTESAGTRSPPLQLELRLKRALGGAAGWNGVAVQTLFVIVLAWMAYEIV